MKRFEKLIGQLDFAADLLQGKSGIAHRLALILSDNAGELLMHEKLRSDPRRTTWWGSKDEDIKRAQRIEKALDVAYEPKTSYLASGTEITGDEQLFLNCAHKFRNEAYHVGILHEEFMHSLAWHHYNKVCQLFVRLRPMSMWTIDGEDVPKVLTKHLGGCSPGTLLDESTVRAVADSLVEAAGPDPGALEDALSASLRARIEETEELVEYLVDNGLWLNTLQDFLDSYNRWNSEKLGFTVTEELMKRWGRRAHDITRKHDAENPGRTLQRFLDLREEFQPFERDVRDAVVEFDQMVDAAVDEMRMEG